MADSGVIDRIVNFFVINEGKAKTKQINGINLKLAFFWGHTKK